MTNTTRRTVLGVSLTSTLPGYWYASGVRFMNAGERQEGPMGRRTRAQVWIWTGSDRTARTLEAAVRLWKAERAQRVGADLANMLAGF